MHGGSSSFHFIRPLKRFYWFGSLSSPCSIDDDCRWSMGAEPVSLLWQVVPHSTTGFGFAEKKKKKESFFQPLKMWWKTESCWTWWDKVASQNRLASIGEIKSGIQQVKWQRKQEEADSSSRLWVHHQHQWKVTLSVPWQRLSVSVSSCILLKELFIIAPSTRLTSGFVSQTSPFYCLFDEHPKKKNSSPINKKNMGKGWKQWEGDYQGVQVWAFASAAVKTCRWVSTVEGQGKQRWKVIKMLWHSAACSWPVHLLHPDCTGLDLLVFRTDWNATGSRKKSCTYVHKTWQIQIWVFHTTDEEEKHKKWL